MDWVLDFIEGGFISGGLKSREYNSPPLPIISHLRCFAIGLLKVSLSYDFPCFGRFHCSELFGCLRLCIMGEEGFWGVSFLCEVYEEFIDGNHYLMIIPFQDFLPYSLGGSCDSLIAMPGDIRHFYTHYSL